MSLEDAVTLIMGVAILVCGASIMRGAFYLPPGTGRGRRSLRLFKGAIAVYIGGWWVLLGVGYPHSLEISRYWIRPASFLFVVATTLALHFETLATRADWLLHPKGRGRGTG